MKVKTLNTIKNIFAFSESMSESDVIKHLTDVNDFVYTKKLEILKNDPTSLDLVSEKSHADYIMSMIDNRTISMDEVKIKFMYELYMYLEDYEMLANFKTKNPV